MIPTSIKNIFTTTYPKHPVLLANQMKILYQKEELKIKKILGVSNKDKKVKSEK